MAKEAFEGLRFLVVEGQSDLRRTISTMLKGLGAAAVYTGSHNEEAIEILAENPVDFILCDWGTPESPAMDLLKRIREDPITAMVPFLLMSRGDQLGPEELAEANEFEASGHLIKPLNQQEIEDKLREILKERSESLESEICLARAGALTDVGAHDEAEKEIQTAQEKKPDKPRVWVRSGDLLQEMGKDEKAKSCYFQAKKVDEEYVKAYDGLASILEKEGKSEEAFELLQQAAKISPKNSERQMRVAKALLKNGDEDQARIALHQALSNVTDPAAKNAAAAEFFLSVDRADLAEAEYAFALEADPENVNYYNRMGIAFRRQKKFKEAIDNYRKALAVAPSDPVVYYNMALAMAENKEFQQSIGALRRAIVLDPEFTEAEKLLNRLQKAHQ